jgi:hypothetical protein
MQSIKIYGFCWITTEFLSLYNFQFLLQTLRTGCREYLYLGGSDMRWKKQSKELCNLYTSPNFITIIK